MDALIVGRRAAEYSGGGERAACDGCRQPAVFEAGLDPAARKLCIHCAAAERPNHVLFVELPPDGFGCRSLAKTVDEVYRAGNGEWHKGGVWHNAETVLRNQD